MKPIKKGLPLPLSLYGFFCIAGALLLLAFGLVRGEMAALFGALALLVYCLCALTSNMLTLFFWRKKELFVAIDGNEILIKPSEAQPLLPMIIPGSTVYYFGRFLAGPASAQTPQLMLKVPLERSGYQNSLQEQRRGEYREFIQAIMICDPAGFFRFSLKLPEQQKTLIMPAYPLAGNTTFPYLPTASSLRGKSTFRRSEELLESRQYQSGDDPRRIHWKAVAHTGELTIRQGELLPPPKTRYTLFVQNWVPPETGPLKKSGAAFENLISKSLFLAESLLEKQIPFTLLLQDAWGELRELSAEPGKGLNKAQLRNFFSIPQPADKICNPDFPKSLIQETAFFYACCPATSSESQKRYQSVLLPLKNQVTVLLLSNQANQAQFLHNLVLHKEGYHASAL